MHTLKPLDVEAVLAAARETGRIVTIEEHSVLGGLGGAVAEVLCEAGIPSVRFRRIGTGLQFAGSGGRPTAPPRAPGLGRTLDLPPRAGASLADPSDQSLCGFATPWYGVSPLYLAREWARLGHQVTIAAAASRTCEQAAVVTGG